jgi:uncharacterized protein (DUF486 family)
MKTVLLLVCSNIFMTLAWYGHLKFKFLEGKALIWVILVSWGIAFFEFLRTSGSLHLKESGSPQFR